MDKRNEYFKKNGEPPDRQWEKENIWETQEDIIGGDEELLGELTTTGAEKRKRALRKLLEDQPNGKLERELGVHKLRLTRAMGYKKPILIGRAITKIRKDQWAQEEPGTLREWTRNRNNLEYKDIWDNMSLSILEAGQKSRPTVGKCPYCERDFVSEHAQWCHLDKTNLMDATPDKKGNQNCLRKLLEEVKREEERGGMRDPEGEEERDCCIQGRATLNCGGNRKGSRCVVCSLRYGLTEEKKRSAFQKSAENRLDKLYCLATGGKQRVKHERRCFLDRCPHGNAGRGKYPCKFPEWLVYWNAEGERRSLRYQDVRECKGNTYWCRECTEKTKRIQPEVSSRVHSWEEELAMAELKKRAYGTGEKESEGDKNKEGENPPIMWDDKEKDYPPLTEDQEGRVEEFRKYRGRSKVLTRGRENISFTPPRREKKNQEAPREEEQGGEREEAPTEEGKKRKRAASSPGEACTGTGDDPQSEAPNPKKMRKQWGLGPNLDLSGKGTTGEDAPLGKKRPRLLSSEPSSPKRGDQRERLLTSEPNSPQQGDPRKGEDGMGPEKKRSKGDGLKGILPDVISYNQSEKHKKLTEKKTKKLKEIKGLEEKEIKTGRKQKAQIGTRKRQLQKIQQDLEKEWRKILEKAGTTKSPRERKDSEKEGESEGISRMATQGDKKVPNSAISLNLDDLNGLETSNRKSTSSNRTRTTRAGDSRLSKGRTSIDSSGLLETTRESRCPLEPPEEPGETTTELTSRKRRRVELNLNPQLGEQELETTPKKRKVQEERPLESNTDQPMRDSDLNEVDVELGGEDWEQLLGLAPDRVNTTKKKTGPVVGKARRNTGEPPPCPQRRGKGGEMGRQNEGHGSGSRIRDRRSSGIPGHPLWDPDET